MIKAKSDGEMRQKNKGKLYMIMDVVDVCTPDLKG